LRANGFRLAAVFEYPTRGEGLVNSRDFRETAPRGGGDGGTVWFFPWWGGVDRMKGYRSKFVRG